MYSMPFRKKKVVAILTRYDSTAAVAVRIACESWRAVAVRNVAGNGTFGSISASSRTRIATPSVDATEAGRTLGIRETFRPTAQLSRTGETGQTNANGRSRWRHLTTTVGFAWRRVASLHY